MAVARVQIPKMGMSTVEVDVTEIFVNVGDRVEPGTPLLEIESEKATATIDSDISGVIEEILVEVGEECQVGASVMRVRLDG